MNFHFNSLVPEITVTDLENSLRFYVGILGFRVEYQRDESRFAFLSLEGSQMMISQRNGEWESGELDYPFGRGINFQIFVSNLSEILDLLAKANVSLAKPPWDSWYRKNHELVGQREFLVQDPDGYLLRFAERLAEGTHTAQR